MPRYCFFFVCVLFDDVKCTMSDPINNVRGAFSKQKSVAYEGRYINNPLQHYLLKHLYL